jgi:hypothetical protein
MEPNQIIRQQKQMLANLQTAFGFNQSTAKEFFQLLEKSKAYIAGGACLAAFLEKPLLDGQDLDVWVPTPTNLVDCPCQGRIIEYHRYPGQKTQFDYIPIVSEMFRNFFLRNGYTEVPYYDMSYQEKNEAGQYSRKDNGFLKVVHKITNYVRPGSNHKIQVIMTYDILPQENVKNFDLNCCMFYWDHMIRSHFAGNPAELPEIQKGYMRQRNGSVVSEMRKKKYQSRGFKFLAQGEQMPSAEAVPANRWF